MRVLVTGAAGFIASHLCERLVGKGYDVLGVDVAPPGRNLDCIREHRRFRFLQADLAYGDMPYVEEAEAIVHCAALAGTGPSWTRFADYVQANVLATQRLLVACERAGVRRFVHVSSSSVYGADATGPESSPCAPISPYGVTKLAGEHLCQAYARRGGLDLTIVRPFSVYGPRQRPDMMVYIVIDRLLRGEPITVEGTGMQRRSFTYVLDLVDGIWRCLERLEHSSGRTFNLGGGELHSLLEMIRLAEKATGRTAELRDALARPGDQYWTQADATAARERLGWVPRTDLRTGLTWQVAWQRSLLKREALCTT